MKIYGPPISKAIKALEKIAINMPEVCIMDTFIHSDFPRFISVENTIDYFGVGGDVPKQRCSTIISKSAESLGEYDFFFEWFEKPKIEELNTLIEKIDETLEPIGARYTITTK